MQCRLHLRSASWHCWIGAPVPTPSCGQPHRRQQILSCCLQRGIKYWISSKTCISNSLPSPWIANLPQHYIWTALHLEFTFEHTMPLATILKPPWQDPLWFLLYDLQDISGVSARIRIVGSLRGRLLWGQYIEFSSSCLMSGSPASA